MPPICCHTSDTPAPTLPAAPAPAAAAGAQLPPADTAGSAAAAAAGPSLGAASRLAAAATAAAPDVAWVVAGLTLLLGLMLVVRPLVFSVAARSCARRSC